ncbi:MAG: TonB-dependent receptor, partial [Chitinophagaceae bacterium]|nr:TonB-dependent receptor [Chitinophagaceae bacterium]
RKNTDRDVTFNNLVPSVSLNYTPKQQRSIRFNYNGSTRNPTLQQIQPILDNIDPLNITIGNPNLKQAFNHNFNFRASDYKVLKSRNISFNMNYSFTDNAISNASTIDQYGRRVNQAINVSGNYNFNASVGYGFDIVPSLNFGVNIGPSKNRYVNMINGLRNETENNNMNFSIYSGYWGDKWINFWLNLSANHVSSRSSIRPDVVTQYWTYNTYSNIQLKFKKAKLYVDMNLEANIYQKTAAFANQQNMYNFSPSIRKVISKDDKWEAKLYVNDLFNQNRGISRNATSNFISETTNQTIQRYFLLSLIYNFSKNGKPAGF